jgi:NADP-dependent aldehyde dehydrogenase
VGTAAIGRFLRPVAYQNAPTVMLPPELRDANPDGLLRMIDGQWTRAAVGEGT